MRKGCEQTLAPFSHGKPVTARSGATKQSYSVSAHVLPFHPVDEGAIHYAVPTRRGVIAGEVPIAGVLRAGSAQAFDALEHHAHFGLHAFRREQLTDPLGDLLGG